jgi:hypothetical protein
MISEEGLQKFIDLYEKKYAVKLNRQKAFNIFAKLINIVKMASQKDKSF